MKVLNIKNMVCPRCVEAVARIMEEHNLIVSSIKLGEVILKEDLEESHLNSLSDSLLNDGFELLSDKKSKIINRLKSEVIKMIHYADDLGNSANISGRFVCCRSLTPIKLPADKVIPSSSIPIPRAFGLLPTATRTASTIATVRPWSFMNFLMDSFTQPPITSR